MQYPNCITDPYPLLGNQVHGPPFLLDLSTGNEDLKNIDLHDQQGFQKHLDDNFPDYQWGLAEYLEYREPLLKDIPQMAMEKRYYHLGLDIIAPKGTALHAPINSTVLLSGYEEGKGNYGGHVVMKHEGDFETFYSLYGHLDTANLPEIETVIPRGSPFARIGNFDSNGDWFHHTHLQIFTQNGINEGWLEKGYCTKEQIDEMPQLCPAPHALFRATNRKLILNFQFLR